jgi:pilus assembly protein CpaC
MILAAPLCSAAVAAPQNGETAAPFDVKVVDMARASRSMAIMIHRSVIVQTSVPITRADAVSDDVAEVQVVSPTELLITGRGYGRTNVVLWGGNDQQYVIEISVELDVEALNETLKSIDPLSSARARPLLGNVVLEGTVSSAEHARRMLEVAQMYMAAGSQEGVEVQNHLDVAGEQQVMLRCVVAELNRSAARQLGINGFLAGDDFGEGFLINQLGGLNAINMGAPEGARVDTTIPFLVGEGGIPVNPNVPLSLGFPRVQMQVFIKALSDNSLLRILAEPNLVAISGETASFLAGGEFPVPVPQGNNQVTIEFREFGVRLNFTPRVKAAQLIRLRVSPEVSELDFSTSASVQGFVVPGLKSRAAETTIEVGSGQTIVIAGLLSEETRAFASRMPGIGDVPILGALFRSVEYRKSRTELVIMVTPELVSPLDAHQVPGRPGDDHREPSDFELYGLGAIEGHAAADDTSADGVDADVSESASAEADRNRDAIHGPWGHAPEGKIH